MIRIHLKYKAPSIWYYKIHLEDTGKIHLEDTNDINKQTRLFEFPQFVSSWAHNLVKF